MRFAREPALGCGQRYVAAGLRYGFVVSNSSTALRRVGSAEMPSSATLLRCLACEAPVQILNSEPASHEPLGPNGLVRCRKCRAEYQLRGGTIRMAPTEVGGDATRTKRSENRIKRRTAESFAYEWARFGGLRDEWRKNFLDYLRPLDAAWFAGRRVLDVGAGSGRHSFQAAELGAEVVAVDLGASIDVARRNLPTRVLTVQADAEALPFAREAFDLVMSIGVLHHLPDPAGALRAIVPFARRGGYVHVYLYWTGQRGWHRTVLRLVTSVRHVTTRIPHRALHVLCYPLAAVLEAIFVTPHRLARRISRMRRLSANLPLKTYADYPFGVLVNDQFDRLSAPLERRYTASEVRRLLETMGLEDIEVIPNHGWIGHGRRPS